MRAQKYKILFFLLAFIGFSFEGFSQKMNLEQCVNHALENNIQLKQSQLNTQISEYNAKSSKYSLLPSINGNASLTNNLGRSVDPFTNQFVEGTNSFQSTNYSLSSQVTLFNGFAKMNTMRKSQIDYNKSVKDFEKARNDIALAVASGYLQVLMAKENLNRSNLQVESTTEQKDRVQKQVDVGALPMSNLLEIRTQLANDEFNQVTSENQLEIARLNLAQLLELDFNTLEIEDPKLDISNAAIEKYDENAIYNTAVNNLPEIKSAELNVESAEKGYQVSKGGYSPTLSVSTVIFTGTSSIAQQLIGFDTTGMFPTAIYGDYLFGDQLNDNVRQQMSLNLSVPIFNGLSSRINVQRSKLTYEIAQLEEQNSKNQLKKSIQQAHTDYKAAAKRYQSAINQLEVSEENYKNAKIRFEQGLLSTTDYRTITNSRSSAQSDVLNAKYDFVFKQKVLDFYQGKEIKL